MGGKRPARRHLLSVVAGRRWNFGNTGALSGLCTSAHSLPAKGTIPLRHEGNQPNGLGGHGASQQQPDPPVARCGLRADRAVLRARGKRNRRAVLPPRRQCRDRVFPVRSEPGLLSREQRRRPRCGDYLGGPGRGRRRHRELRQPASLLPDYGEIRRAVRPAAGEPPRSRQSQVVDAALPVCALCGQSAGPGVSIDRLQCDPFDRAADGKMDPVGHGAYGRSRGAADARAARHHAGCRAQLHQPDHPVLQA